MRSLDVVEAIVLTGRQGGLHSLLPGEGVDQDLGDLRPSHADRRGQLLAGPLARSPSETLAGGLAGLVIVQVGVTLEIIILTLLLHIISSHGVKALGILAPRG